MGPETAARLHRHRQILHRKGFEVYGHPDEVAAERIRRIIRGSPTMVNYRLLNAGILPNNPHLNKILRAVGHGHGITGKKLNEFVETRKKHFEEFYEKMRKET